MIFALATSSLMNRCASAVLIHLYLCQDMKTGLEERFAHPGYIALTWMLYGPNSFANALVSCPTAAFIGP